MTGNTQNIREKRKAIENNACSAKGVYCSEETACKIEPISNQAFCVCTHNGELPVNGTCQRSIISSHTSSEFLHANLTNPGEDVILGNSIRVKVVNPKVTRSNYNGTHKTITLDENVDLNGSPILKHLPLIVWFSAIIFFLTLIISFCFFKKRRIFQPWRKSTSSRTLKMKRDNDDLHIPSIGNALLPSERFVLNPTYEISGNIGSSTRNLSSIPIFHFNEINIISQIGQGCFGKVFKAELKNEGEVAVKMVGKESAIQEIEAMASFSHENILKIIGVVMPNSNTGISSSNSPWLIFEYMEYGDLATVLRTFSLNQFNEKNSERDQIEENMHQDILNFTTPESLLKMVLSIAEGMNYLSSQHFVHRDLAARNCLVGKGGKVKISDFGLSRDVYVSDYYQVGGSRMLPVRWMSPESLLYGRFTLESDVWAYGVLLWEVYSFAKQPYYGHSNEEVVELVLEGILLQPPRSTPPLVSSIMALCWKTDPKNRIKFKTIVEKFKNEEMNGRRTNTGSIYEIPMTRKASLLEYMEVI